MKTTLVGAVVGVVLLVGGYFAFVFAFAPDVTDRALPTQQPTTERSAIIDTPASLLPSSDEEVAVETELADDMEYVHGLPFPVRKDRDCTIVQHLVYDDDNAHSIAVECIPNQSKPVHHLAEYDEDTLRVMAYRDPEACEILAIKLIEQGNEDEGLEFTYRAVALTEGKSFSAFVRTHNTFYTERVTRIDGELVPNVEAMEQAYIFGRIRQALTGAPYHLDVQQDLSRWDYEGFDLLDQRARATLESMAQVEMDVVGSRRIKEKMDAQKDQLSHLDFVQG